VCRVLPFELVAGLVILRDRPPIVILVLDSIDPSGRVNNCVAAGTLIWRRIGDPHRVGMSANVEELLTTMRKGPDDSASKALFGPVLHRN
jgi:hypothetical protein